MPGTSLSGGWGWQSDCIPVSQKSIRSSYIVLFGSVNLDFTAQTKFGSGNAPEHKNKKCSFPEKPGYAAVIATLTL